MRSQAERSAPGKSNAPRTDQRHEVAPDQRREVPREGAVAEEDPKTTSKILNGYLQHAASTHCFGIQSVVPGCSCRPKGRLCRTGPAAGPCHRLPVRAQHPVCARSNRAEDPDSPGLIELSLTSPTFNGRATDVVTAALSCHGACLPLSLVIRGVNGVPGPNLVVTGPAKSTETLRLAGQHSCLVAIDSLDELACVIDLATPVRILLRCLPPEDPHSRFGLTDGELALAMSRCCDADGSVRLEGSASTCPATERALGPISRRSSSDCADRPATWVCPPTR